MKTSRKVYFATVDLREPQGPMPNGPDGKPTEEKAQLQAALTRAYQLRNFEIEHYWKRATYFWAFQIASFAAYGLLLKEDSSSPALYAVAPVAMIGLVTAVANLLSAEGSKFWQNNWERHIDLLEEPFEGRLHKTVWLHNGKVGYSVSRINETVSKALIAFWIVGLLAGVRAAYFKFLTILNSPLLDVLGGLFWLGATCWLVRDLCLQRTNFEGTLPTEAGGRGLALEFNEPMARTVANADGGLLVRRDAPGEQ